MAPSPEIVDHHPHVMPTKLDQGHSEGFDRRAQVGRRPDRKIIDRVTGNGAEQCQRAGQSVSTFGSPTYPCLSVDCRRSGGGGGGLAGRTD
jgi:hypothetical protein